jgi:Ca-activated chloride channel homolog
MLPAEGSAEKSVQANSQARRDAAVAPPQNAQQLLQTPGSDQPGTPDPNARNQVQSQQESARAQSGKLGDETNGSKESTSQDTAQSRTGEQQNGPRNGSQQSSSTKELDDPQTAGNQQNSNGLLNRMRDALSGLMAKMRQNESAQKQGENSRASNDKKAGEQLANNNDQSSQSQQSPTNQQAREQQSSQGQGQTTEKAQSAPASNANQLADKKRSDSQSGIGRQDGDKTLKEAEEQKAMGKLADIIGKRSASVTGDMTVETGSGKQELQTRFTGRMGIHSDTGGEINRDDIPVEFQAYVRAYMEQIRKQQTKTQ